MLVVQSALSLNGGLLVLLDLLERWQVTPGVSPRLFVAKQRAPEDVLAPDGLAVSFGGDEAGRTRRQGARALVRLVRLARAADVVISGSEIGESVLLGYVGARLARRPFVVVVHADLDDAIDFWVPWFARRLTRWANAHADASVCVAPGLVQPVLSNGALPSDVHVVVNGIDVGRVQQRALLPAGAGDVVDDGARSIPLVVANGRLAIQKGFDLLIEAHARVLAAGLPHRLVITGEGPQRAELEALVARLGVTSSVDLPGFAANPYPTIAAADVFVLSSRSEGLPLTLLEALALGAPVIATECGSGPRTVLGDCVFGELVRSGSVEALADALAAHLRTPDLLRERARGGPARALAFDVDRAAAEHLTVLRSVVDGSRSGVPSR
ncbi:MAG: glycosyl transferase group 1 [Frankiales bacterium]|nr:glycosyl transferase group 1 [Frankiales bacterium]